MAVKVSNLILKKYMQNVLEISHWRKPLEDVLEKNMKIVIREIKCNDANSVQIID
jgi:hypothetical protein